MWDVRPGDLVIIEWDDSVSAASTWVSIEQCETWEVDLIRSVGWVLKSDETCLQLYAHDGTHGKGSNQISGDMLVPINAIRSVTVLH